MERLSALWQSAIILGIATLCAAFCVLLPDDPYQRWQQMRGTEYDTLTMIYERVHYDPRPLDAVVLGSSKTAVGVSIRRIRDDLARANVTANVANFSVMAAGRDKDYAIVKEILKEKSPKILVIGVEPQAYPYGHPTFKYFADSQDILINPAIGMHDYLYNLAYLPFRQFKLFFEDVFPRQAEISNTFSPQAYRVREAQDLSYGFVFHGSWLDTTRRAPLATLEAGRWRPKPVSKAARLLQKINDGVDHEYIRAIAELACRHRIEMIFLYIPEFGAPPRPEDQAFLSRYGDIISLGDLADRPEFYMEVYHFNRYGAAVTSDRIAAALAAALPRPAAPRGCGSMPAG